MTTQEFSIEFDILYNNLASNTAPPLNEYEKSVFLTKAQSDIVIELYSGRNNLGLSYESSEEVRNYLKGLLTFTEYTFTPSSNGLSQVPFPTWLMFITREELNGDPVIPISQDEYNRIKNNPFKGPNKNKVLAVSEEGSIILYSKYSINTFYIKYLKRPNPIVLDKSELKINGVSEFNVEIPESLHNQVLYKAVQLAKVVWQS